jgi:hypothetical protein
MGRALTDSENLQFGALCGWADVTLLQGTNYLKNASQQGLPFTLDPRVLYRGYTANVANNGFCIAAQFYLNGIWRKLVTGGSPRPLSDSEKIGGGVFAGALSGIICGPIELVMIQQQRKGGGLMSTSMDMVKGGHVFRGVTAMMAREGIYAAGFLGVMPVAREYIQKTFPDSMGKTEDTARLSAAFLAGPWCGLASHPPDTLKTCMQGDIEQATYKGYMQTMRHVVAERGVGALWAGFPWRCFRQICCLILFDKMTSTLQPIMFPDAFATEKKKDSGM